MSSIDKFESLTRDLRQRGYSVMPTGVGLRVDLPMFCSVDAMGSPHGLQTRVRFGSMGRTEATGIALAVMLFCLYMGAIGQGGAHFAVLASIALVWDAARWIMTQCVVRQVEAAFAGAKSDEPNLQAGESV